jgi:hypothetical protein
MIVALIALFAALGGTGYAALKLPKNSVSAKQIKKNAVTAAKIKKNAVNGAKVKKKSLTGSDINLAKLGTVPSAETANVANSVPPLEATHLIGAPGEPVFEGGATNFGSTSGINTQPAGFYKDHDGTVHLQGLIKTGPAPGAIFSLPAGFRPAPGSGLFFNVFCAPGTTEDCLTDEEEDGQYYAQLLVTGANVIVPPFAFNGGVVSLYPGVTLSLDGLSFRAAG